MGTQLPPHKGGGAPSPIFGPFRLWPNGWMHQDATWYGGRPQPRGLCVRWGPSPLPKMRWSPGTEPPVFGPCLFWPNSWMHQDATWYGGDFVLDGYPAPYPKGAEPHPIFGPRLLWPNDCMDQDATWYGDRSRPMQHCVRCGPSYPQKKGRTHPHPILAHVYCCQVAGWMKTPLGAERK